MFPATVLALMLAQPANPWLNEAKALVAELRFEDALRRLELARAVPDMTVEQRHEVIELSVRCLVAEGRRDAAIEEFTQLLREEPGWQPERESTPPKVLEVFDDAKTKLYPPDFVLLELVPAPVGRVSIKVVDPWRRVSLVTRSLRVDSGPWEEQSMKPERGQASFDLVIRSGLQAAWFVEAVDAEGAVLAHLGTATEPRLESPTVEVKPHTQPNPTLGRRTGGWVVLGLGIAAGIVATVLQVNGWNLRLAARDGSRPPGDWVDTALAAEAAGVTQTSWATGLFIGAGVAGLTGVGLLAW